MIRITWNHLHVKSLNWSLSHSGWQLCVPAQPLPPLENPPEDLLLETPRDVIAAQSCAPFHTLGKERDPCRDQAHLKIQSLNPWEGSGSHRIRADLHIPRSFSSDLESRDRGLSSKTLCMESQQVLPDGSLVRHYDVHNLYGWSQTRPTYEWVAISLLQLAQLAGPASDWWGHPTFPYTPFVRVKKILITIMS